MKTATWSFDDGGPADLPVLEILRKRGIPATFYLVMDRVSGMDPRVYDGVEVGSHTVTHPNMRVILPQRRLYEMDESRKWLASFIGKPVIGIAWPGGGYIPECGDVALTLGYLYGRGYYVTQGNARTVGGRWNRGISVKFQYPAGQNMLWIPTGEDVHLVGHPHLMDLVKFEATLQLIQDDGYRFVTNAEFYQCL